MTKLRRSWRLARRGLGYRYPPCCIARFVVDVHRGREPGVLRGATADPHVSTTGWVPCGVWHRTVWRPADERP